jgi:hypothetical protein
MKTEMYEAPFLMELLGCLFCFFLNDENKLYLKKYIGDCENPLVISG